MFGYPSQGWLLEEISMDTCVLFHDVCILVCPSAPRVEFIVVAGGSKIWGRIFTAYDNNSGDSFTRPV
ncbi:hypothetical protein AAC03nite_13420 [Alicyclobacillus acidoterrestris]|nr:hypothetical protein AAC03nite_13420 [Alicyclobacillus acidoterrestris]